MYYIGKIGEDTDRMDEEVKLGKTQDLKKTHDITNGASDKQKMNITYSFGEECKQILFLTRRHSPLYLVKFMFLAMIVVLVSCITADSYHTLIVSSFTLLGSLLFDQLGKKKVTEEFDFKRAESFCDIMFLYMFFLFFLSTLLLLLENVLFKVGIEGSEACISLEQFKWIMFFALESSTFSALVEAIVNIPEETLPSRQQKTGSVKLGTNIDTNCND